MPQRRKLFWTITGSVVAVVAVVVALILVNSGSPPRAAASAGAAASSVPPSSATASSPATTPAPVVTPKPARESSFSYLSDLAPSGSLADLVSPGPVKIAGAIYPKSISFYCNVGDPTAFPDYKLGRNARRFDATVGLGATYPPHFEASLIIDGDGHTLRTVTVSGSRPATIDVDITGVHILQLECFGGGQSSAAGWAVSAAWGNARVVERR